MDIKTKYGIDDKIVVKDHTGADKVVKIISITLSVRKKLSGVDQMVLYTAVEDDMSKMSHTVLECDVIQYIERIA